MWIRKFTGHGKNKKFQTSTKKKCKLNISDHGKYNEARKVAYTCRYTFDHQIQLCGVLKCSLVFAGNHYQDTMVYLCDQVYTTSIIEV